VTTPSRLSILLRYGSYGDSSKGYTLLVVRAH
jgi:hypothetical protein